MAIATTAAILGGMGKLYSDWRAGREAQKGRRQYRKTMEESLAGERADIAKYLEPDAHRDYMQTAEAQSIMETSRQNLQDASRQIRGGVARAGGTTEAAVAGQEVATGGYADILSRLAAHGTQYRQYAQRLLTDALSRFRGREAGYAGQLFDMSTQRAGQHAPAGQNWLEALLAYGGTQYPTQTPAAPTQAQKTGAAMDWFKQRTS